MAYITNFDASNRADFVVDISATDADTGDDIDFTGAEVSIAIKAQDDNCYPYFSFSIGGGITQPSSTVLELTVTAEQMQTLQPGTYRIGGVYTINDATTQIFRGEFVVYDGVAPLP